MSRKGLRRLLMLLAAVALVISGAAVAWVIRNNSIQAGLEEARTEGMALYERGEHEKALPKLGKYVARHKDNYDVIIAYAECQAQVPQPNGRHFRSAITVARLAAELDPERPEAHEMLLGLYAGAGFFTELSETASRLLRITPDHRDAHLMRIAACLQIGNNDDAVDAADEFLRRFPDDLDAHLANADVLRATNDDPFEALG